MGIDPVERKSAVVSASTFYVQKIMKSHTSVAQQTSKESLWLGGSSKIKLGMNEFRYLVQDIKARHQ